MILNNNYVNIMDHIDNNVEDDILDLDSFETDDELIDALGIASSSDHELETKIHKYIQYYKATHNDLMESFFMDVYRRLFDIDGLELPSNVIFPATKTVNMPLPVPIVEELEPQIPLTLNASNVNMVEYTPGLLNPLMKETTRRLINIDSQQRHVSYNSATDFTINFTEVLKNVVKIQLYSITIPYQWYTISNAYGSNFFIIKGISPGIDDGTHDIQIRIDPGTYSSTELITAIKKSITELPTLYPGIDFGNTDIKYSTTSASADIVVNLRNPFNETHYGVEVQNNNAEFVYPSNTTLRSNNLGAFLGFNERTYTIGMSNTAAFDSDFSVFNIADVSSSNNTIRLVQYTTPGISIDSVASNGVPEYSESSLVIRTISFSVIPNKYTYPSLIAAFNSAIKNSNGIDVIESGFYAQRIGYHDTIENEANVLHKNHGKYQASWIFRLDRNTTTSPPHYKLALLIPNDIVWTKFDFIGARVLSDNIIVELNNTYAETPLISSNFKIDDTQGSTSIVYTHKNVNISGGTTEFVITPITATIENNTLGYTLAEYLSVINASIMGALGSSGNAYSNVATIDVDDKFSLPVNINIEFDTSFYDLDYKTSITTTYLPTICNNVSSISTADINNSNSYTVHGTLVNQNSFLVGNNKILCNITTKGTHKVDTNGNGNQVHGIEYKSYEVKFKHNEQNATSDGTAYSYPLVELVQQINSSFFSFVDDSGHRILQDTTLTITVDAIQINTLNYELFVKIACQITENEFSVKFNGESWTDNLKLSNESYNIGSLTDGLDSNSLYRVIKGTNSITSDVCKPVDEYISLFPDDNVPGVAASGSINIWVDNKANGYARQALLLAINDKFTNDVRTRGTQISVVAKNGYEYTKIRWNVAKEFTARDYSLLFYDTTRFVTCFTGNKSYRNVKSNSTLGWILGYHVLSEYMFGPNFIEVEPSTNTTYYSGTNSIYSFVTPATSNIVIHPSTSGTTIVPSYAAQLTDTAIIRGDTTVNVNIYNSFFVLLNDFNQNHMNDGIVTIAAPDYQLTLPSYASRHIGSCNPSSTQNLMGVTSVQQSSLTKNQLYAVSQIIDSQNARSSIDNQSNGVYLTNVFASIPLKLGSIQFGQNHTELSGTLQNQDRTYFGPVNINRMNVKLVNDHGDTVDLNGQNWSMQILCDMLYQSASISK